MARRGGRTPRTGGERALALSLRDQWRDRPEFPYIRAAGTWLTRTGSLPAGLAVEAADADALLTAALGQLDDGADLIKLYLDGPDAGVAPWSADEVRRVVDAVHARGATVAAHGTGLANCRVAAESAVDTLEHGFTIDADIARLLAENRVTVVSTLSVLRSWQGFATTTTVDRFTTGDGVKRTAELRETAEASIKAAHAADVPIAAGSDFGGGSVARRAPGLGGGVAGRFAGLEPWEALGRGHVAGRRACSATPAAGAIRESAARPTSSVVHGDPLSEPAALWRVWHVQ